MEKMRQALIATFENPPVRALISQILTKEVKDATRINRITGISGTGNILTVTYE